MVLDFNRALHIGEIFWRRKEEGVKKTKTRGGGNRKNGRKGGWIESVILSSMAVAHGL